MSYPNNANQYLVGTIQTPSALEITAITKSYPMSVTINVDPITASNTYIAGQLVKLNIPYSYGMFQANGLVGKILSVGMSTLQLNIDSTHFDSFVVPPIGEQPASLAPAGAQNLEFSNLTRRVPFQSLNNRGN